MNGLGYQYYTSTKHVLIIIMVFIEEENILTLLKWKLRQIFRPHFGEAKPFLLKALLRVEPCFKWQTIYMCVFQHYLKSQPAIAKQLVKLDTVWFDLIGTGFWFDLILIFGHCQGVRSPFCLKFLLKPFISLIVSPVTRPFKRCFKRYWFVWAPFPVYPFIKREKICNAL